MALQPLCDARRVVGRYRDVLRRDPRMAWHFLRRGLEVWRRHGVHELTAAVLGRSTEETAERYGDWVRRYDTPTARDEAAARRRLARLREPATFTMIAALRPEHAPERAPAVQALRSQWYPHWELVLVESPGLPRELREAARQLRRSDGRIRSIDVLHASQTEVACHSVLTHASGHFCGVIDLDARLAAHALLTLALECEAHPDADMLYSDEDRIDPDGRRHTPLFKPDWNPDRLRSHPYVGHITVYRTGVLRNLAGLDETAGWHEWELSLRASAAIPATRIRHVPHVLYHAPAAPNPACRSAAPIDTACRILRADLQRTGDVATLSTDAHGWPWIRYSPGDPPPLVSIIIPTRNGKPLLERCLTALRKKTDYPHFELLIIDNQSDDPATVHYLAELHGQPAARVLRFDAPFNFSAMNNFAAGHARGALLAFLNNDVEVLTSEWLTEMVGHARRSEVGAVGAKLYYPDGRIQHAGIILGFTSAGHIYRGLPEPAAGPASRTCFVQNVAAVTAACLVMRTGVYHAVGGFDVNLPVAYGDVDLCLRVRQRGYRIVWTPHAQLSHWESATRGLDDSVAKIRRLRSEQALLLRRWGPLLEHDPAYNPNLTLAAPTGGLAFPPRVRKPWRGRR